MANIQGTFSPIADQEEADETTKFNPSEKNTQNIQFSNMVNSTEKYPIEMELQRAECRQRIVSRIKLIWAFISFLIAVADVAVIIVVTYLHFLHQHDILAWLMLLPILLNFIGIFTFLSDENERRELEELAGSCRGSGVIKNLMILPVFGPAFSSLRLFIYAIEEKTAEQFERLESLLTKMKQYESFFRASPEAFIQMTYRIVSWSTEKPFDNEDHWTSACLLLCIFSLAESNFYGIVRPYYRMFSNPSKLPEGSWNTEKITIPWRVLLFVYTYASIASRLMCDAILRATVYFVFEKYYHFSFGEVIALTLLTQFVFRALSHALFLRPRENLTLANDEPRVVEINSRAVEYESGPLIYRAFTYSWRSIFMAFDFQNPDRLIFSWFYIENVTMLVTAYLAAYFIEYDLREKYIYFIYTGIAVVGMVSAISIKLAVYYCWRRPYLRRISAKESDSGKNPGPVILEVK